MIFSSHGLKSQIFLKGNEAQRKKCKSQPSLSFHWKLFIFNKISKCFHSLLLLMEVKGKIETCYHQVQHISTANITLQLVVYVQFLSCSWLVHWFIHLNIETRDGQKCKYLVQFCLPIIIGEEKTRWNCYCGTSFCNTAPTLPFKTCLSFISAPP